MIRRKDVWPLGALGFILAVTAAWWTLALWSAPGAPEWLERTRSVCFNITENGLPDAKGWLLLLGQPPSMLALLLVGWRDEVREALEHLRSSRTGRAMLGGAVAFVVLGAVLSGVRVAEARLPAVAWGEDAEPPPPQERLNRPWPAMEGLIDQHAGAFSLERLDGRPSLVTFAFGHCSTLCPAVVHQTRAARAELGGDVSIVVFTLDPWRDTPGRLPALVRQFELDPDRDFVVSGPVEAVEASLDAWGIARDRDTRTGDIIHPGVVYVVEADGTVAYAATGGLQQLVTLARRIG